MKKGFTLLELIIVVIILGILVSLAVPQYTKATEKARQAEALMALGFMRNLAYQYYLQQGTLATITTADLGVGAGYSYPSSCTSTHYFWYSFQGASSNHVCIYAQRCKSIGKPPQWGGDLYVIEYEVYPDGSQSEYFHSYDYVTGNWCDGYCIPPF